MSSKEGARVITIVIHDGNNFDVFEGEAFIDGLTWDEMLGEVASLTHPRINTSRYHLRTPEEYDAERQRRAANYARAAEELKN